MASLMLLARQFPGMWTRFAVAAHLSADELSQRYRMARDPVERSHWQMIWLLVSGRSLGEVAAVTGYSTRWIREVVRSYNANGVTALVDQRHANAAAKTATVPRSASELDCRNMPAPCRHQLGRTAPREVPLGALMSFPRSGTAW